MTVKELCIKNRSYRRYDESKAISREMLEDFIDATRYNGSTMNLQPLKFYISCDKETNEKIFPLLKWAAKIKEWNGPEPGERPAAYIVVCLDKTLGSSTERFASDVGIVSQTITLCAMEKGIGCCMILNYSPAEVSKALDLPETMVPCIVISLGTPAEEIILKDLENGENSDYYRDEQGKHYVPKRKLKDIIL